MILSRFERSPAGNPYLPAALTEQQRQAHPHVIYMHESQSAADGAALAASVLVAQRAGLDVIADVDKNEETGQKQAVIRSSNENRNEVRAESMLLHGVHAITERTFFELSANDSASPTALEQAASVAEAALRQITDNPELRTDFVKYYGGLRWGTDQENFTADVFKHATELDLAALPELLTSGYDVAEIVYKLDLEIPYDQRRDWHQQTPAEVFAQIPEIDYQRLADPDFRQSAAGQQLAEAYREFSGNQVARLYKQYPRPISDAGAPMPKPVIPLSRFPIIEAIMTDEVSLSRPKAKYDMSPREVNKFILHSDSLRAQQALAASTTIRLPKEFRHVFDGPDELQHKRGIVLDLTHTYMQETDPARKEQFKLQLLDVFDAYTQNGRIADEVRAQHESEVQNGIKWHTDTDQLKQIVEDMLVLGLASPNAEAFVGRYMPDYERGLAIGSDPLALSKNQMMMIVIDALGHIDTDSQPAMFELTARKIFQDETLALTIRRLAELKQTTTQLFGAPEVWLARRELGNFRYSISKDKTPEELQAREVYDTATAPAEHGAEMFRIAKNDLLIGLIGAMVEDGLLQDPTHQDLQLFKAIIERIRFGETLRETHALPPEYVRLTELAEQGDMVDAAKGAIFWKFAQDMQHAPKETAGVLVGCILDGYRMLLGEPQNLRLPGNDTGHALAGLGHIADGNPVFKYATQDQLDTLTQYKNELVLLVDRVIAGQLTDGSSSIVAEGESADEWLQTTLQNLEHVVRYMSSLEQKYEKFLHIEAVQQYPHVYYPWMLKELNPFWRKMQWEVGPGNRPSKDIQDLYNVLQNHVTKLLDTRDGDYPENFDAMNEGHLGTLLHECYTRMFLNHQLQYNGTVWREGMAFVHTAFRLMPKQLVDQFRTTYANEREFMGFIEHMHPTEQPAIDPAP